MKFCPQVYKITEDDLDENGIPSNPELFTLSEDEPQMWETCCKSLLQCDEQKRAELKGKFIEDGIRHCECEKKIRDCLTEPDFPTMMAFGVDYFVKTAKCFAVDYPIKKCSKYSCFYQPNTTFNQYPKGHIKAAVRCVDFEFDESKPQAVQTFELPFYYEGFFEFDGGFLEMEAQHYKDGYRRE